MLIDIINERLFFYSKRTFSSFDGAQNISIIEGYFFFFTEENSSQSQQYLGFELVFLIYGKVEILCTHVFFLKLSKKLLGYPQCCRVFLY